MLLSQGTEHPPPSAMSLSIALGSRGARAGHSAQAVASWLMSY